MHTYTLYPLGGDHFGYYILADGNPVIQQDFAPGVPGFNPMTEAEADAYAKAEIARFEPATTAPTAP